MSFHTCTRCGEVWAAGYHICPPGTEPRKTVKEASGFVKHDKEKEVYALIPPEFEEAIAKVLTFGARKYSDENWKKCKTPWRTYYSALRRHLAAVARGERVDPDSGQLHLAHAGCCLVFLSWFDQHGGFEAGACGSEGGGGSGESGSEPGVDSPVDPGAGTGRPLSY